MAQKREELCGYERPQHYAWLIDEHHWRTTDWTWTQQLADGALTVVLAYVGAGEAIVFPH